MYFRPFVLWVSGLLLSSPMSMSAIPSVTSPLAGPTKFDRKSLILSMRTYERAVTCISKPTDLFLLRNSHLCLSLGGTSRVSVDKTRRCDVTKGVTGRVQVLCHQLVQTVFKPSPAENNSHLRDVSPTARTCRLDQLTSTGLIFSKTQA
jgi:hypothetical protein